VAWVSARVTILGGVLLTLSVLAYTLGWERGRSAGRVPGPWLVGSMLLFAASLLARATGLVLPGVLVLLDVYPFRRLGGGPGRWLGSAARRVWVEKLGFAALALLAVPMGFLARGDEVGDFWRYGYDPVIALAWSVYGAGFYVWKTLLPVGLGPLYPMPERADPMLGAVALSAVLVVAITAGLFAVRRRWPGALTAWIAYLVILAPLSGALPFGRLRGVADRYTYAACIGWAIVAGGAAALGWRAFERGRADRTRVGVVGVAIIAVLLGWSVLTWHQAKVWRDGATLWSWALVMVPDSPVAHNNLAWILAHAGELGRAEAHARRAARVWPDHPAVLQTLARILAARGQLDEAATVLRRLVVVAPNSAEVRADLGSVLYEQGASGPATRELQLAVKLDPEVARAHDYLGRALAAEGRHQEAEVHRRRAAELRGQPWPPARPGGS
jgi:Flp pilus assembly protein TadD